MITTRELLDEIGRRGIGMNYHELMDLLNKQGITLAARSVHGHILRSYVGWADVQRVLELLPRKEQVL